MNKPVAALRGLLACGFLLAALLAACSSSSVEKSHLQDCKCGTPDYDLFGCTSECSLGEVMCDNPLCTCEHEGEVPDTASKPTK